MASEDNQWSNQKSVHESPYVSMPDPPHDPIGPWQQSYYDPTSKAPLWGFVKLDSGPCSIETGRVTDGDFPSPGPWKQV